MRAIWPMRSANLRGFVYCRCCSSSFSAAAVQLVTITPLTRSPRKVWCAHGLTLGQPLDDDANAIDLVQSRWGSAPPAGVPCAMSRPSSISATRVPTLKAWSGSCVESSTASPRAASRLISDSTVTWLPKSRLAVGSSMTMAGASCASARATRASCRCPPLMRVYSVSASSAMPSVARPSSAFTRSCRDGAANRGRCAVRPMTTMSTTRNGK